MRYKIRDQVGMNFLTFTVVDWLDVFTRSVYSNIIIESIKHCQDHKGLIIYAYVIMSNHIHLIGRAGGEMILSDIIRDFKRHTTTTILKAIATNKKESRREWMLNHFKLSQAGGHQFWQKGNRPIELYSTNVIWQKINYIHLNPVRSKIVVEPEHYLYSSATNYATGMGLIDVVLIDDFGVEVEE